MQMIRITGGDYSQYEDLLLLRDEFEKEAEEILLAYTRIFGDISAEIFKLKIDCIALKKSISFCVAAKNRGEEPNIEEMKKFIAEKMEIYQMQLDEMLKQNELSKSGEKISAFQLKEIKRIYRKIAKVLHPDISNLTAEYPALADLFQRVIIAYQCNDYKEIKEAEVLVNRALEEIGEKKFEIVIPDIENKIEELEEEIRRIKTTEPYTYREILENSDSIRQKTDEFEQERESYRNYKRELEIKLREVQEQ